MDEPVTPPVPQEPPPPTIPRKCRWGSFRWVWQMIVLVAGVVTIVFGIIMLPLPGPGIPIILAGFGILATEFIWAEQLLTRLRVWCKQVKRRWTKSP